MAHKRLVSERIPGPKTIEVESPVFSSGGTIPRKFTGDGDDISPPLTWRNVPPQAKALVLMVEDPDAPKPEPFVHWVAYEIPPQTTHLSEGIPAKRQPGRPSPMRQGSNDAGTTGWMGPAPPRGHGTHHYHFELFALDEQPKLPDDATRDELARAMAGHVLASGELVGTYTR
jgi:Raf kinase inhibitor-like YbhB/YbcL family protein